MNFFHKYIKITKLCYLSFIFYLLSFIMIPSFQYYFPNVIDGINQKHLNLSEYINKQKLIAKKSIWQDSLLSTVKTQPTKGTKTKSTKVTKTQPTKVTKTKVTKTKPTKVTNESEMMIDNKYLGKIIGRDGTMIHQIRTCSNTQITIYKELYDNSKRKIVISGNQNCIQKAKNNILQLCLSLIHI